MSFEPIRPVPPITTIFILMTNLLSSFFALACLITEPAWRKDLGDLLPTTITHRHPEKSLISSYLRAGCGRWPLRSIAAHSDALMSLKGERFPTPRKHQWVQLARGERASARAAASNGVSAVDGDARTSYEIRVCNGQLHAERVSFLPSSRFGRLAIVFQERQQVTIHLIHVRCGDPVGSVGIVDRLDVPDQVG